MDPGAGLVALGEECAKVSASTREEGRALAIFSRRKRTEAEIRSLSPPSGKEKPSRAAWKGKGVLLLCRKRTSL